MPYGEFGDDDGAFAVPFGGPMLYGDGWGSSGAQAPWLYPVPVPEFGVDPEMEMQPDWEHCVELPDGGIECNYGSGGADPWLPGEEAIPPGMLGAERFSLLGELLRELLEAGEVGESLGDNPMTFMHMNGTFARPPCNCSGMTVTGRSSGIINVIPLDFAPT